MKLFILIRNCSNIILWKSYWDFEPELSTKIFSMPLLNWQGFRNRNSRTGVNFKLFCHWKCKVLLICWHKLYLVSQTFVRILKNTRSPLSFWIFGLLFWLLKVFTSFLSQQLVVVSYVSVSKWSFNFHFLTGNSA